MKRSPKGNHTFARWNAAGESSVLKLVKFGLGNRSFQVFTEDVADGDEYSILDEPPDVKRNENSLLPLSGTLPNDNECCWALCRSAAAQKEKRKAN